MNNKAKILFIQAVILMMLHSLFITEIHANATIQVTFQNTPYGTWTQNAKDAFLSAMFVWENTITSTQIIHVVAKWEDLALKENNTNYKGVLGYAKPTTYVTNFTSTDPRYDSYYQYPLALAEKLHGAEILQSEYPTEIECSFNSNGSFDWYFDNDGNCPNTKFDLVSVVLHEIGHGIGFFSAANQTDFFTPGTLTAGWYGDLLIFDKFIKNSSNDKPIDFITPPVDNFTPSSNSYLTSNDLYFTGNSATWNLTWSNQYSPAIYAPATWTVGSSISHFDETFFNNSHPNSGDQLMTPFLSPGESRHNPGYVGLGLLVDIGWDGSLYLSTESIAKENSTVSIFPNPCSSFLKLTLPEGKIINTISVYSLNGQHIFTKNGKERTEQINIENLVSGLYMIKATDKNNFEYFNLVSKK